MKARSLNFSYYTSRIVNMKSTHIIKLNLNFTIGSIPKQPHSINFTPSHLPVCSKSITLCQFHKIGLWLAIFPNLRLTSSILHWETLRFVNFFSKRLSMASRHHLFTNIVIKLSRLLSWLRHSSTSWLVVIASTNGTERTTNQSMITVGRHFCCNLIPWKRWFLRVTIQLSSASRRMVQSLETVILSSSTSAISIETHSPNSPQLTIALHPTLHKSIQTIKVEPVFVGLLTLK